MIYMCRALRKHSSHIMSISPHTEPSSKDTVIQWGTICPRSRRCQLAQTGIPTSVLPSSRCPNYASASCSQLWRKEVPSKDLNLWIPQLSLMANRWINRHDRGITQALWGEKEDSSVGKVDCPGTSKSTKGEMEEKWMNQMNMYFLD